MSGILQVTARVLPLSPGAEGFAAHRSVFGPLPLGAAGLIDELERSGLVGHGGAAFPAATKWRAVAERSVPAGGASVVGDGVEAEPASYKDRTLLALRPHLVVDGMLLAAAAVGARRVILCVPGGSAALVRTLGAALRERRAAAPDELPVELVAMPNHYVAGEESALVNRLNGRAAKPHAVPPRPFESGVGGRPALVSNVETFAHAALIARYGAAWFRSAGPADAPGTTLVTVSGGVGLPGVREVTGDMTVGEVVAASGGAAGEPAAVLVGGYFGRWIEAGRVWNVRLAPGPLAAAGLTLGAGVIAVLPSSHCGVTETDRILSFLARESAGQCGPCAVGLPALANLFHQVAAGQAPRGALQRCTRWAAEIRGRGACRHPDGATLMVASAMEVFAGELKRHLAAGRCPGSARPPLLPTPVLAGGWR